MGQMIERGVTSRLGSPDPVVATIVTRYDQSGALPQRVVELDGIRGWAALGVAIFHLTNAIFGITFPIFRSFPFTVFSGPFAVALFFVLSGEALSTSFLRSGKITIVAKLALKRHTRLSIPIFGSVLLAFVLQRLGVAFNVEASGYVGANRWLAIGLSQPMSILHAIKFSFLDVYMTADPNFIYNPMAWTMCIEMIGSIIVFALLPIVVEIRFANLVLIGLATFLFFGQPGDWIADFVIGILLGRLRQSGVFYRIKRNTLSSILAGVTVCVCLTVSAYCLEYGLVRTDCILAAVTGGVIFSSRFTSRFFSCWVSQALGKISFALYLCQFAILNTFTSYLIVRFHSSLDIWHACLICLSSLVVMIVVAICFEPLERLTAWVGNIIVAAALRQPGNSETV